MELLGKNYKWNDLKAPIRNREVFFLATELPMKLLFRVNYKFSLKFVGHSGNRER